MVHDYLLLNEDTQICIPMPQHDTNLDSIYCGRPRVFSQTGASWGFLGKIKTGFRTTNGLYRYDNMSMGLTGSPNTCARCGDLVFGHLRFENGSELPSMLGYLDEVSTVFFTYFNDHNMASETFDDHFEFL
ncbi:unnamed protein product [Fusarium langsethiae]|nr:unnamed protein product [Fusarium langsethiae]